MNSPFPLLEPRPTFWVSLQCDCRKISNHLILDFSTLLLNEVTYFSGSSLESWYDTHQLVHYLQSVLQYPVFLGSGKNEGRNCRRLQVQLCRTRGITRAAGSWCVQQGQMKISTGCQQGYKTLLLCQTTLIPWDLLCTKVCWHFLASAKVITNCTVHYLGSSHPSLCSLPKQRAGPKFPVPPPNEKQSLRTIWCLKNAGTGL